MLGLGQSLTHEVVTEGLISLGGFTSLVIDDANDDENVQVSFTFTDQTMDDLLGYDGAKNSEGDKQGGTYTLTVSRLDGSGNVVGGATSSGTVYAYRAVGTSGHSPGACFFSTTNSSNVATSNWNAEGSALIDLSSFGGSDITGSDTSSNYRFTATVTGSGYTLASLVSSNTALDKP